MGKKKEPSIQDSILNFKDVMQRASTLEYISLNKTLLSKNSKNQSVLITTESDLWLELTMDEEFRRKVSEIDLTDIVQNNSSKLFRFADDDSGWFEIDSDLLFKGQLMKITIDEHYAYQIPINRDLLPLKLKKAEYNMIYYKVFTQVEKDEKQMYLGIKKTFLGAVPNSGFSLIKLLQIV